ncbi:MAG: rRNA adenine N-6-methyltransferase family protein [Candidatus Nanosalina sp.]
MFRPSFNSNDELVDSLVSRGYIESEKVEDAFRSVDRAGFVPDERQDEAYNDYALPIGEEATISAPHMVAINTELLAAEDGDSVIEIGSGSGYQLAVLSEMVGDSGSVKGVEIDGELVRESRERVEGRENIDILHGSGFQPVNEQRRYDRILYSCAIDSIEEAKPGLKDDGIIVAPVNEGDHQVVKRYRNGEITRHQRVRFVDFREE